MALACFMALALAPSLCLLRVDLTPLTKSSTDVYILSRTDDYELNLYHLQLTTSTLYHAQEKRHERLGCIRSPKFILDVKLDDIPIFIISIDSDLKLPHQSSWSELKILVHAYPH